MLLRDYEITFSLPACLPNSESIQATATFSDDVREVLPYLNALLKGAAYDPEGHTLRFWHDRRGFTIYPDHVSIAMLKDAADGHEAIEWLKGFINETYGRRDSIEPSYRRARELQPLQIYRLLPGTNCKECGEPTCFAFAARLLREDAAIDDCVPFSRGEYADRRDGLIALYAEAGRGA